MLTREENELVTRVGPGTPMGDVMRRYWVPALMSRELPEPDCPPARVQLLGEKLKASLQKPIESVDFRVDPDTAKRVREALASRKKVDSALDTPEARIMTSVQPIGSESETLGVLLRITAISRK